MWTVLAASKLFTAEQQLQLMAVSCQRRWSFAHQRLYLDHFKAQIKTDLQVFVASVLALKLFIAVVFLLQLQLCNELQDSEIHNMFSAKLLFRTV